MINYLQLWLWMNFFNQKNYVVCVVELIVNTFKLNL